MVKWQRNSESTGECAKGLTQVVIDRNMGFRADALRVSIAHGSSRFSTIRIGYEARCRCSARFRG